MGLRVIVGADLRATAQRLQGIPWPEFGPEARVEVIEAVVAAELLALEGRRRVLDRAPGLVAELAELRRRRS